MNALSKLVLSSAMIALLSVETFAQTALDPRRQLNATAAVTQPGPRFNPNTGMPIPSDLVQARIRQQGGTKVPILVPFAWTQTEAAAEATGFKIKVDVNNYTAIFRPPGLETPIDVVIDGTVDVVRSRRRELSRSTDPLPFALLGEVRGGSISFERHGAAYLVQFFCIDDRPADAPNCIEPDVAQAFVSFHLIGEVR